MKGFITACVLAITVSSALAITEEGRKKIVEIFKKCKEENLITDADENMLKKYEGIPSSPEAKCLTKCLLSESKILEGGRYNKDAAIAFVKKLHSDEIEEVKKAREVIDFCINSVGVEAGNDECDYAYKMAICGLTKGLELGMKKTVWD